MTNPKFWWWFFLGVIGIIVYYKKKESLWYLLPIILALVISDHIASSLFKPLVGRLRPCYNLDIQAFIHQPKGYGCGGQFGFFSSHSATAFGLAFYIYLIFKNNIKWVSWGAFAWALPYSYTRIYLGKHYPLDILLGAICGVLVSYIVFLGIVKYKKKFRS